MESIQNILEKLRKVENLVDEAATDGEQAAAKKAHERLMNKLERLRQENPPKEMKFTFQDPWGHRLFMAICRHFDLEPYRYKGQHRTTVQLRVPEPFVDETLWPMFSEYYDVLHEYLMDVTDEVIHEMFGEQQQTIKLLSKK